MLTEVVSLHEVIEVVITALNARDPYTYEHSFRVAFYAEHIAYHMALPQDQQQRVHIAAHLHDIGKIGVPDAVLNKSGVLTAQERLAMQAHAVIGYDILRRLPLFSDIARIVLYHHERLDGQGYPEGLIGDAIPLESRIIAVADAFDAMTSQRPYRQGGSYAAAALEINAHSGEQFDPQVVAHFNAVYRAMGDNKPAPSGQFNRGISHADLMHSRRNEIVGS